MNSDIYLKQLNFWKHLSLSEQEEVKRNVVIKEYKKGKVISNDNDRCLGLITIISGKLRIYTESEEEKQLRLYNLKKNDSCVLTPSCNLKHVTFKTKISVEENTKILAINAECIEKLIKNNIFVKIYVYELVIKRFSDVMVLFEEIMFNKFYKRLIIFLLNKCNEKGNCKIRMKKTEIAKELNSAREVVSRNIKMLENKDLLNDENGIIIIKDFDKLSDLLEKDYI